MIVEHVDGFVALLTAISPSVRVYSDGKVPNEPVYPYLVVYPNQGVAENASMADASDWQHFTFQTTKVALTQAQARLLADREHTALLDRRPAVTGRSCGQISKLSSQIVRPDFDVTPLVFYATDTWTFTSVPA